ncbi:ATP-dependent zinc metalloprotease FtsH [Candidatus Saccharibacteria bacterium]|nr:ATP-dependent zinc metalloprotease FtsH [Candidatus Saccharibacteria bacterium]MCB9821020.1 ATP-dependent zinc metalloprotease FtsH [Candidatus Nomurabacteria bacterium]
MKPKNNKPTNQSRLKSLIFITILALIGLAFYAAYSQTSALEKVTITRVIEQANNGEVSKLIVEGEKVEVVKKGDTEPSEYAIRDVNVSFADQGLVNKDVELDFQEQSDSGGLWISVLSGLVLPIGILLVLVIMFRSAQGQGSQAMSFGKSKARLYGNEKDKVTFSDIAGNENAKEDLAEVVDFLRHPEKFKNVGAKIPKGVLLVGPPGTGKTMIARAVAGEAKVPFFSISGSEFVEMFVGVGASRVRDLFNRAKKNAPCIIFIDEIDAVGRKRGSGMGGGHDEREQTLNQILVEMDGFEQGQNVILLAATNRADVLDPALLRPGRFDRRVNVELPDRRDREEILKVHFKNKPVEKNVDLSAMAAKTAGSSGADLANIANESAIKAARRNSKTIANQDLVEAFEKVAIGPARKNNIMTDKEKELTAYHEAGHALVGHLMPESDMVHKVTIVSRGHTGGVTWFIPPEDQHYHSIKWYKDVLARILGGRIAEKIIYGPEDVTTGAGSDLQKAVDYARDMVIKQGMGSKDLRDMVFHSDEGMMFDRMVHDRPYSEETAQRIDKEVAQLVSEAAKRAEAVIAANLKYLEALKETLIKKETVEADEVVEIFKNAKLPASAKLD